MTIKPTAMTPVASIDKSLLHQWISDRLDLPAVEEKLHQSGLDKEHFSLYLKEYKRLRAAKRQFRGFIFVSLGAFAGFVSCILSVLNPVPDLFNLFLYGFTSVAIVLVFTGLYFLFE